MMAVLEDTPLGLISLVVFPLLVFGFPVLAERREQRRLLLHELSPNSVLSREPRRLIGSVREGDVVKVVGHVHGADEALVSPLGGLRCVFYRLRVESNWNPAVYVDEERDCPFTLQDETGQILVRLGDVRGWVQLQPQPTIRRAWRRALRALLRERGVSAPRALLRATEQVLPEGTRVAVLGEVCLEDVDPAALAADPYRGAARRLVLRPIDPARGMAISDDFAVMGAAWSY